MNSGEIVLFFDNKKVFKGCNKVVSKESQCVQEASATIKGIKKEIEQATITITIEYSNDKS